MTGAKPFDGAGLGLFVHYGHYAAAGWDASWGLVGGIGTLALIEPVSADAYHANASNFGPKRGAAAEWVDMAAAAGARYAVLTTRHHDGFALWPSQAPGAFTLASIGLDRDLVREFADACRARGLGVGCYYSLSDWKHPDYPAFQDEHRPYAWGRNPAPTPEQWARYLTYLRAQLTELLTDYGPVDVLWFDGGWERSAEQWDSAGLEQLIRSLQPRILLNDRLPGAGDYVTPEQFIPAEPPAGRWESCLTMNRSWGFNAADDKYKTATGLVHALCETVGRGGNLLLNIGPEGDGSVPAPQAERWATLAEWMSRHAEAIHDVQAGLEPWRFYGPSTRKGHRIFAFLLMRPLEPVAIRGLPVRRVKGVRLLGTGEPLKWFSRMPVMQELFSADPRGEIHVRLPDALLDPHATVLEITLEGEL